jgi:hypothetical protein
LNGQSLEAEVNGSRNKIMPFLLLVVCLGAGTRVGVILYEHNRAVAEGGLIRLRASQQVLQLLSAASVTPPALSGDFPCVAAVIDNSKVQVRLSQCGLASKHSGPVDRFETDLRYGSFILRESDLYVSDIFDVPLTRTYNSGDYVQPNRVHAFGRNTTHPYDIGPVGSRYPYTYQMLVLEDGNFLYSPRVSQGTSFEDAVYQHTETSSKFYKAVTGWNGGGWTTWLADGSMIVFPEAYRATNAAQGAAVEMVDAAGNKLELLRDKNGNLQKILTPHKHSIMFDYDFESSIIRAQDDQGHWAAYQYNVLEALTDAALSSGRKRHFSYEGDLMTMIEDENGQVLLRNTYSYNQLVRQEFGNGEVYSYAYTPSPDRTYAEAVDVTLPDGTKTRVETGSSVPAIVKQPQN